ncbi:dihydrolipoamide acetyltransferase family protein [Nocardia jiangxiensis]|uniref:Dihydrolipoamide acetyltransferase component of pyruvate dehydrogenase complex n=1 Tax=Nocardia jiangxiensis TaxID=282685 RepID=A0ABW6RYQ3_9NOCA
MTNLIDVHMPHMGAIETVLLTTWLKEPGDRVEESDGLCEVSTDKVDTEIASPATGFLIERLAAIDAEIPVGAPIARFAPLDASAAEIAAAIAGAAGPEAEVAEAEPPSTPVAATNGHAPSVETAPIAAPATTVPVLAPAAVDVPDDASLVLRAALTFRPAAVAATPTAAAGEQHGRNKTDKDKRATPFVRKLADEYSLDLAEIAGTGPGGRVTRQDVEAAVVARPSTEAAAVQSVSADQPTPARHVVPSGVASAPSADGSAVPAGYETVPHEAVSLTPQRRAIARNLVESVTVAPQLTAQVDVDMTAVLQARATANAQRIGRGERKISVLPFIGRALCATVAEYPDVNATFTDTHLLRWKPVNLAIAVDAPHGLLVPVIRNAQHLTLFGLAGAISEISARVIDRKASGADLSAGTITISNSGSVGGVVSTPILTRPQVASIGVPAVVRTPVAVTTPGGEEYVAIRPIARIGLTFDHRAFDGALALRALQDLQHKLETWSLDAYL